MPKKRNRNTRGGRKRATRGSRGAPPERTAEAGIEPVVYGDDEIAALDKDARQGLAEESDLSEVMHYVELGRALHSAHVLELLLASLTTMHEVSQAARTPHEFDRIFQANLARPLGEKVGLLRSRRIVDAAQARDLERAVAQRNKVAHWYTVKRLHEMETAAGRWKLIRELSNENDELAAAVAMVSALLRGTERFDLDDVPSDSETDEMPYLVKMINASRRSTRR
jgi:hypothetical protein